MRIWRIKIGIVLVLHSDRLEQDSNGRRLLVRDLVVSDGCLNHSVMEVLRQLCFLFKMLYWLRHVAICAN
jgi:hypothetical protein